MNAQPIITVPTPFTILIDQQEGLPYSFSSILSGPSTDRLPYSVRTQTTHLKTGDYTIAGLESLVSVERKSPIDAFNTIGQHRGRFQRELSRLNDLHIAAVVVECEWSTIFHDPPEWATTQPHHLHDSILEWHQRYPRVHWYLLPDRDTAEVTTFRILEKAWDNLVRRTGIAAAAGVVVPDGAGGALAEAAVGKAMGR